MKEAEDSSRADAVVGVGNYRGYYSQRPGGTERLQLFKKEWFWNKCCIDIGCNSGHLTFSMAEKFGPRCLLGVDVDQELIHRALNRLEHTPAVPADYRLNLVPRAVRLKFEQKVNFPANLKFECWDIAKDHSSLIARGPFDTIVCCSLTKWIHLNHGDAGLMIFFRTLYELLSPGGTVVMEYQPWKSYERNKNSSEITKAVFKSICIRPEHFESILVDEIGFIIASRLGKPLEEAKGFDRPILILRRPIISNAVATEPAVTALVASDSISTNKRKREVGKKKTKKSRRHNEEIHADL